MYRYTGGCREVLSEIVDAAYQLYLRGLNTLSSGNLSALCPGSSFIVLTPSGLGKHSLEWKDLVFYDVSRGVFIGLRRPTSEYRLHLKVYMSGNPKVGSVAHAHVPQALSLYDAEGLEAFLDRSLVETKYVLGRVCSSPPLEPGSEELALEIASRSFSCDVVIVPHHGAFAFHERPLAAAERLLALEYIGVLRLHSRR